MSCIRPPFPIRHPLCLVFLAGVLLAAPLAAADPAPPWDSAPFSAAAPAMARAAAKVESEEGDDVVVLLAEASYSYDAAGRETYSQRLVYKILTATAHESWSTVEEGWAPWHQARPEIRARVITPDGAEHLLDPATVTENAGTQDSPDMFEDGRVLRAPLPATRPGAVVEQQVTVHDQSPFFDGGVVRFHGFDLGVPVLLSRLVLETPAETPLRWVVRVLPEARKKETVAGGRRRVEIEARDLEPEDDPEPGLPPDTPRTAYVAFSTGRSWGDLARRYSALVDQTIRGADLTAFMRSATSGVKGEAPSQLDLINLYLARLGEEVRYTGIELGEGGMVPRKPAETLRRRFGDCKDKAVLLTAMLRASDIPAYVALLNAGEDEADVEETLPGFGTFNHAIVVVPGSPALWIDPTDPYARAGELPLADQGRLALIATPTATGLTRSPESTSADNREVETREFLLADLGPSRIVETTDFFGAPERALRAFYAQQADDEIKKALKEYAASYYLAEDVALLEHSKPHDLTVPLHMRLELKNARRGFTDARNAAVGINPTALLARLPADLASGGNAKDGTPPEPRQSDYVFREPMQLEVRYRLVPPAGYVPQALPAARTRRFGSVALTESYAAGPDNVVTASFLLDTGKRRITAQEYEAVRKGVHEALQEKTTLLMFDQAGEAHLDAGRVREALQELERLAALSPQKALPRSRVARALLAGGMGEAARREARKATQLEPKLAAAWRTLGWVLQHDELGRRLRPGYDRNGAVAAYRKARELDPKDDTTRADLAILLEYDAKGRRYSAESDLAAAIAEYQALRRDLNDHGMDDNLLVALVRASRFDEARKLAAEMKDSQTGSVLSLVATAATEGAEAAVMEGERKFADEKARATALQQAGQNLLLVRRYADAAVLFDRAGRQSANPAALLSLADLVRRARRHEEIQLPPDQPSTVFRRLLLAMFTGDLATARLSSFFSRDMQAELAREKGADETIRKAFSQMRESLKSDVPADTALDLGLTALRETLAGDDEVGYRINFTSTMGETSRQFAIYVVREGGEYRLVGANASAQLLALEVLRRLDRGDLRGASQWLDWAAEDARGPERTGGDSLPHDPFPALWAKGSQGDAAEMRCAAAALLGCDGASQQAAALLLACQAAATATTEPARRNVLDLALALAYENLGRYQEMEKVSRRLLEAVPDSERADGVHTAALLHLDRWDEIRASAEQRLQRTPNDGPALHLLARDALHANDFDRAEQRFNQIVDAGKATANDFNELAWMRLELGRVDDKTLEYSQRATTLSSYGNAADLHTLASIYAEMGKTAEAYRLILQSLAARSDEAPASDDWYVFGRLAENYGLPDVAREYYKRVAPPAGQEPEALSTHALAARRLAALGDTAKAAKRAK
jgi:transglutaminase-like putative cysteine protease/Flp pilus assembly protein TadD